MNWTTPSKSRSTMIHLFTTVVLLFSGSVGWAKCSEATETKADECESYNAEDQHEWSSGFTEKECKEAIELRKACNPNHKPSSDTSGEPSKASTCSGLASKYREAKAKYNERCAKAGVGQSCDRTVNACKNGLKDGDGESSMTKTSSVVMGALSQSLNLPLDRAGGVCSSMSGRDLKEQQDKLKTELDTAQKDIKENKDALVKLDEDFNKQAAEMDDKVNDLKAKYTEDSAKIPAQIREQQGKLEQAVSQTEASIRDKEKQKLTQGNRVSDLLAAKAKNLAKLAVSNAATACYQQALAAQRAQPKVAAKSVGEYTSSSGGTRALAQKTYAACLDEYENQRQDLLRQTAQQIQDAHLTVDNLQSEIDNLNQQLSTARDNLATYKLEQAKSLTDYQNKVNAQIEVLGKSRIALETTKTARGTDLTAEKKRLEDNLAEIKGKISRLGVGSEPLKNSDVSIQEVYSTFQQVDEARGALVDSDCPIPGQKKASGTTPSPSTHSARATSGASGAKK